MLRTLMVIGMASTGCSAPESLMEPSELTIDALTASVPTGAPRAASCPPGVAALIDTRTYPDIQAALDASVADDTIQVCPGTHPGGLFIPQAGPLVIIGDPLSPATTVIDGNRRTWGIATGDMAELSIAGLTVIDSIAAIDVWLANSFILSNSEFIDNFHSIGVRAYDARVNNVNVYHSMGKGIGFAIGDSLKIENVSIIGNEYDVPLYINAKDPEFYDRRVPPSIIDIEILNVELSENINTNTASVIQITSIEIPSTATRPFALDVRISDVRILNNGASVSTGAAVGDAPIEIVSAGPGDVVVLDRVTFEGNEALSVCGVLVDPISPLYYRYPAPQLHIINSVFLPCVATPWVLPIHVYTMGHWETTLVDVDVGTGPTANPGGDFFQCRTETDGLVSGEIRPAERDYCP